MKYMLIAASLALPLAVQPVHANEPDAAKAQKNTPETLHAPTNRVGDMVPTMTAPGSNTDAASTEAAPGEHKAETVHPPTNRVGQQVPTMKSAKNKDDQKKSKTYYYGDDKSSSN